MPPTPAYSDAFNADLLARLPLAARSILDVGCHTGALGAAYRRRNPRARLIGIEADAAAAALARTRLDAVHVADVEAEPLPAGVPDGLDAIVYGDVLEHLRDPFAVMARQMAALAREGVVLACVPNVEHWSFASRLLHGIWDYDEQGLFDRTHLRWFSRRSMTTGLERLGLTVCDVTPRIFDAATARPFLKAIGPALTAMGVDPADYAARALPLQYIWRARRTAPARILVAATRLRPVGGVSGVRIDYPQEAIATDPAVRVHTGPVAGFPAMTEAGAEEEARIAVLHRPLLTGAEGLAVLRRLLQGGYVVVTEFDDLPEHFPAMRRADQYAFTGVHAAQTTTSHLAGILRAKNPEVGVFPNAIREVPEVANFAEADRLTLFFGALNREADWAPYLPVLNEVAARAGGRLRFRVVHDRALFEALTTPHKEFTPTCDHATYLRLLGQSEICFMPLADTAFNRAKSDLKFIEAGACRVAALASPVVYAASLRDGETGALFRDAEELRRRLSDLVAYPDLARRLGDAARAYVIAERMLADQVAPRLAWYRDLWARREDLTRALLARVPELAAVATEPSVPG
jgi:SAM-dependent methyltransferase